MTTFDVYIIQQAALLALCQRVDRIVQQRDLKDWDQLYHVLVAVHPLPTVSIFPPHIRSNAQPLTQCSYYSHAPDLVQHELPNERSIRWVLKRIAELTAFERCHGGWSKFSGDFIIHVSDHVLPRHPELAGVHAEFINTLLQPPSAEIAELEFLRTPDGCSSVLTGKTIQRLVEAEDRTRHLAICAETFAAMPDDMWKLFANDITKLELFLRLAALRPERALWYTSFAT